MTAYSMGLYYTSNGRVAMFSGVKWRILRAGYDGIDMIHDSEHPLSSWIPLKRLTTEEGTVPRNDHEKIKLAKEWWSKSAKREDADWTALIELAEILMKDSD